MSNIFHNDPNYDPRRFNPLRPNIQKGMSFEEHQRIVAAGIKKLGIKADKEADFDLLMKRTRDKITAVRDYANAVVEEHRQAGRDVDRVMLAKDIQDQFCKVLYDYTKDELYIAMSLFLSQLTMNEVI